MSVTYRAYVTGDREPFAETSSLREAVRALATAWRCPFEALHTEQSAANGHWNVYGPENQDVGHVVVRS